MKYIIYELVATNTGWITRQALKYSTIIAAVLGGYLAKQGVDADLSSIITVAVAGSITFITEQVLSFIAKKHAVK
jgi:ABC-type molybdate transport system substrate-binding protein